MLVEAITILLLLGIASVCFIRQKKYFLLQAVMPLAFMPFATLLMHSFIMNLAHTIKSFNGMVYGFYSAAALLTLIWVIVICTKLKNMKKRLIYALPVLAFCGLLGWLFLQANLI